MRLLLLLLTSSLFLAAACTKADDDTPTTPLDELPPATQVGANTFGCLIDGVPFVNQGGGNFLPDISGSYINSTPEIFTCIAFEIDAATGLLNSSVSFRVHQLEIGKVEPRLNKPTYRIYTPSAELEYFIDSTRFYEYRITHHDPSQNIVSGIFENFSFCPTNGDTVHIKDGRFDVVYFE